jgi:hypothetical protein
MPSTMTVAITEEDVDKRVVDREGAELGIVVEIHHGTAHVSADEETVEEMQTRLPEGSIDEEMYAVHDESIADITDDEIVLDIDK